MNAEYPEHEKMKLVQSESQACGAFLDWLNSEKGYSLCRLHGDYFYPVNYTIEGLLAEYFNIDLNKVEKEKRAMLDYMREADKRAKEK